MKNISDQELGEKMVKKKMVLDLYSTLNFNEFEYVLRGEAIVTLGRDSIIRLRKTRELIENLLTEKNVKIYGCNTGFADLRDIILYPEESSLLSHNILQSHDSSIGKPLRFDVVLGAMLIRAHTLSKGFSGIRIKNLEILISLINARIVPLIGSHGSIGASDIPWLARLGRLIEGQDDEMLVYYKDGSTVMKFGEVKKIEMIESGEFLSKEGLAISSGSAFSLSIATIAYLKMRENIENIFGVLKRDIFKIFSVKLGGF